MKENDLLDKQLTQTENKLILLYLIDKMDIPLSNSQISHFALSENYMNYFSLQECLSEMVEIKYLDSYKDNNTTRYTITDEGLQSLDYFEKRIPIETRNTINEYVIQNRKRIKRDYETTANYFKELNSDDFTVKCALYEDDAMLMEINLSVVSRDQAKLICNNWKTNISTLYGDILSKLITTSSDNNNSSFSNITEEIKKEK